MSGTTYAWLVGLHGHLAALGIAVLLHPVITLRRRKGVTPAMMWSAEIGAVLLALPFALGLLVYPTYRHAVKPVLWLGYPEAVLRFESKEHLAALALACAISGALTLRFAGRREAGREAAWSLLACAFTLGVVAAVLGLFISGRAHPAF